MPRAQFTGPSSTRSFSDDELARLGYCGHAVGVTLSEIVRTVSPGDSAREIAERVGQQLRSLGVVPILEGLSLNGLDPFPCAASINVNEIAVNGVPSDVPLEDGDLVTIDVSASFEGMVTDGATMVCIGSTPHPMHETALRVLEACLGAIRPGERLDSIADAAREMASELGVSLADEVVAHGIGRELHQPPAVFLSGVEPNKDALIEEGIVLALEPVVVAAPRKSGVAIQCETLQDGWSRRAPGLAAFEERTVLVTQNGCMDLTPITPQGMKPA